VTRYLLDTTVLIDHANGHPPAVMLMAHLYSQPNELYTCDVVACESRSAGTDEHLEAIESLLEPLDYVAASPEAADWAAASRLRRHREGRKLGLGDALIAGVAATIGATIVTRNRPDFESQGVSVLTY
jgi:predicted nucleic acid-binding protein